MSNLSKTIEIIIKGQDYASDSFKSITANAASMNQSIMSMTDPFANIADSVLKAEGAILALGAAFTGLSISKAIDAESAITELKKVLSEDDIKHLDKYKKQLAEVSNQFAVSIPEATRGLAEFKQAGYETQDAMVLLENALKLVNVSELNTGQATEAFVKTLAGFGAKAKDTTRIIDNLNYVSNNYGANVQLLSDAQARSAAVFSQAGFSMEEQLAVLTPIIEVFQRSEIAATAFNSAIVRLSGDSKPVVDALKNLGVAQKDSNGQLRKGRDIWNDVLQAVSGLSEAEQQYYATKLFGVEAGSKLVLSFKQQNKSIELHNKLLKESAGSAQNEFNVAMATTEKTLERLKNSFNSLLTISGDQFLSEFNGVGQATNELVNQIQKSISDGAFDEIFDVIKENFVALEQALGNITENLPAALEQIDLSELADSFRELFDTAGDFLGFDFSTESGLAEAIQFLIDSITSLNQVSKGILDGLKPFFDALKESVSTFNNSGEAAKEAVGSFLGLAKGINSAASLLGPLLDNLDLIATAFGTIGTLKFFGGGGFTAAANGAALLGTKLSGLATTAATAGAAIAKFTPYLAVFTTSGYLGFKLGEELAEFSDKYAPDFADTMRSLDRQVREFFDIDTYEDKQAFKNVQNQVEKLEKILGRSIDSWGEYQEAVKDLQKQNKELGKGIGEVAIHYGNAKSALSKYLNETYGAEEANNKLKQAADASGRGITSLEEKLVKFTKQAKIEAINSADIFKSVNGFVSTNVGAQIQALDSYINAGRNISKEAAGELSKFLDNAQQQTSAISNANVGLIEGQTALLEAQAELIRLRGEQGEIIVNGEGLQPHLQAIMGEILKELKISVKGGQFITGG